MSVAKRKDANTDDIMIAILESGWKYIDTHDYGKGFPDCIAYKTIDKLPISVMIEIKSATGNLTKAEKVFHAKNEGLVYICRSGNDVKKILNDTEKMLRGDNG